MDAPRFFHPTPAGYSHAVRIPRDREIVWTSGQVGLTEDGVAPRTMEAQARLAFEAVGRALEAASANWHDVVKLTLFVTSTDEIETLRRVRDEFVDTIAPPTSSLVVVAGLFRPDLFVEVEAVAAVAAAPAT
ncbi:RidA family protein [Baekduia sp. Peel2402]|uniref:RidA family protein n=1 Tax=Baekduia sp. Peel2402 TaxID=3458296 RepID=UPI00403EB075